MTTSNTTSSVKPIALMHPQGIGTVHFHWTDDRFDHSIFFRDTEVASRRGAGEDAWPDSPPIQQLSIESIEGRNVALGVGCAGTSHWSLSVEPTPNGFRFDWACRTKETPDRLGTAYTSHAEIRFDAQADSKVSQSSNTTHVRPDQPLDGAGTFRWQYEVSAA